jgi:hypothetical protein
MIFRKILFFLLFTVYVLPATAQNLAKNATDFLNALSPELKTKAMFTLEDVERFNFNFVPLERRGVTFRDFDTKQKDLAVALLRASLSEQGYQKANGIMELENVLIIIENQKPEDHRRDPLNYHFLIFGKPSNDTPWGWRFEGHHLSLSFFSTNGVITSSTPTFFGSNPGTVKIDEQKGKQVLKQETTLGFQLVNALAEDQLKVARFSEQAPAEIITGNDRKARNIEPRGISYSALNESQKKIFTQLLDVYMKNYEFGFSKTLMEKIKAAGFDNLTFAWAGGLTPEVAQYYRIQGPMLLIEYDNIQNNANHVHTIVRDLTNDFAEDILQEHYRKHH